LGWDQRSGAREGPKRRRVKAHPGN
jgi:hypothetical protein